MKLYYEIVGRLSFVADRLLELTARHEQASRDWAPTADELEAAAEHCDREYAERMQEAVESPLVRAPSGMTLEEKRQFILSAAETENIGVEAEPLDSVTGKPHTDGNVR